MFRQNGPWLGQVRLVARPGMGSKETVPWDKQTAPKNAKPPEESGCLFLGIQTPSKVVIHWESSEQSIEDRILDARTAGYRTIETDVPDVMCPVVDPNRDPNMPTKLNEVPASAPCYEAGSKFVWACPGVNIDQQILYPQMEPISARAGTETLPLGPKPDLVPVAAGAGVVAILAAVIGGVFGK